MRENLHLMENLMANYSKDILPYKPFALKKDRTVWDSIPSDAKEAALAKAKELQGYNYPLLPTNLYMDFLRTGNRTNYQSLYFSRRRVLNDFVLAECFENTGAYMDDIINGVMAICEESGWQIPSHNRKNNTTERNLIADEANQLIDLYSGETAAQLAMILYLFEDDLNALSPLFKKRIKDEIKRRIEIPYLTKYFFWMGQEGQKLNNWTTWSTLSVLISLLLIDDISEQTKREVLTKACRSLDLFITGYDDDGFCAEGASYYHGAGVALFQCIAVLNKVTNNNFESLYKEQKIKNIASYIMDVHIAENMYANYSDCSCKLEQTGSKKYLAAKAIGDAEMMKFAAKTHISIEGKADLPGINLHARVESLLLENEMRAIDTSDYKRNSDRYFKDAEVLITRDNQLFVTVIGGNNADPHGHNDKGSFIVYKNGKPLFIDAGVEAYTKKTFSPERYDIWTMRSNYHNLINFGEIEQVHGEKYYAEVLNVEYGAELACMELELINAYSSKAVQSYRRKVTLEKNQKLTICDTLSELVAGVRLSLLTSEKPVFNSGTFTICGEDVTLSGVELENIEKIELKDKKTQGDWGECIYRTLFNVVEKQVKIQVKSSNN